MRRPPCKSIVSGGLREGVAVRYYRKTHRIQVDGWYDSMVGIEPMELSLAEFLTELGITSAIVMDVLASHEAVSHD